MANFLELNDAAQLLGVPPDKLVEMRSNGEIRGFRDGASWKFKEEEIERLKDEMGAADGGIDDDLGLANDGSVLDFDDLAPDDDDESILVSEEELGHSGEKTSSTIIGKKGSEEPADSDLMLTGDSPSSDLSLVDGSDLSLADSGGGDVASPETEGTDLSLGNASGIDSDLGLAEPEGSSGVGSDVTLVPGVGDSDVSLVPDPGSDKGAAGEAARPDSDILADDSELTLDGPDSGGTGNLELGADTGLGSAISDLDMALDSELALSDDDDIVLSGSGTGSDLALSAADSGINLSSPTDSGLSLEADSGINLQSPTDSGLSLDEEPLDLGGSSISSLELPEDDEVVGLDDTFDLETADSTPAPVKKDEEFLLSPSDEMFMDESDSGSQVIALEDSEAFDQDAATLVPDAGGQALLAETAGLEQQLDSLDSGGTPATIAAGAPTPVSVTPDAPETPYTIWNVLGLLLIIMFLSLSGILMTDMMKNMWAWEEEGHEVATGISKALTEAIGLRDE